MTNDELMRIPYRDFVGGLFVKPAGRAALMMHAAIGIVGEVIELRCSSSPENELEELGDLWFYLQAMENCDPPALAVRPATPPCDHLRTLRIVGESMLVEANEILDICKKYWVYEKEPDMTAVAVRLWRLREIIDRHAYLADFTLAEVELANRVKLLKRYPGGGYTNEAAQARADKGGGE